MLRSHSREMVHRKRPGSARAGLRVALALSIALLQLVSALHFWLVPHAFSAALGGVVHVDGVSSARSPARARSDAERGFTVGSRACASDLCPFADAPAGTPLVAAAAAAEPLPFGQVALPRRTDDELTTPLRILLEAPKTSPPV